MPAKKYFTDEERKQARRDMFNRRRKQQELPRIMIQTNTRDILRQFREDNHLASYDKAINKLLKIAGIIKPVYDLKAGIPQLKGRYDND